MEDLRCALVQAQKESQSLKSELQAQREANSRAPTTTMRNLVDRLKSQLALKEKQQKVSGRWEMPQKKKARRRRGDLWKAPTELLEQEWASPPAGAQESFHTALLW